MELFKFLKKESGAFGYLFVFLGILSGLANAGLLKLINNVISELSISNAVYKLNTNSILLYLVVVAVLIFSQRIFSKYIITLTQKIISKIQLEILDKIRYTNYSNFKNIGRERIYTSLTQDAGVISSASASIVYGCTSLVTVVFCLCYLAYVSLVGFGLTLLVIGVAVTIYMLKQNAIEGNLTKARELQNSFFKLINDLLSGFKEIKVNQPKSDDLYKNYIEETSVKARDLSTKAIVSYLDNSLTGQLAFFLLIGFILFCFPLFVSNHQVVVSYIFIILYILGPIEGLMTTIPGITQANIAIKNIRVLQEQTTSLSNVSDVESHTDKQISFDKIVFDQVGFSYNENSEDSFSVGPINMEINKGELLFIVGGNGSGKTTMFKILTGLFYPQKGSLELNGKSVTDFAEYRNLFSPIYSDFYLFDRFYGMSNLNPEKVNEYIELMQLSGKVSFAEGKFSKTDFSTGQRKRLALIVSLLEERPILVLDEWAADQDPPFRKFFYETFLPKLKQEGKTIIAITHDDKYFHLADRMYKMEYGKLNEQPIFKHSIHE